jgi:hypothetical protein
MDNNAAAIFYFVLMTQTGKSAVFSAFNYLGDLFNLALISSSYSSCVKWNLLLETFLHNSTLLLLGAVPVANFRLNSQYRVLLV